MSDELRERYTDAENDRLRAELAAAKARAVENGKEVCRRMNDADRLRATISRVRQWATDAANGHGADIDDLLDIVRGEQQ